MSVTRQVKRRWLVFLTWAWMLSPAWALAPLTYAAPPPAAVDDPFAESNKAAPRPAADKGAADKQTAPKARRNPTDERIGFEVGLTKQHSLSTRRPASYPVVS